MLTAVQLEGVGSLQKWKERFFLFYNNQPISFKLSLLFCLLLGIVLASSTSVLYRIKWRETRDVIRQSTVRNSMQLATSMADMTASLVEEMLLLNEYIAGQEYSAAYDGVSTSPEETAIALRKYVNGINLRNNNFQYIHSIIILYKGQHKFSYRANTWDFSSQALNHNTFKSLTDLSQTSQPHWTSTIDSSTYFSENSIPIVSFVTPFFPAGSRDYVVVLNLSVSGLVDQMKKHAGQNDGFILDCAGSYITTDAAMDHLLEDEDFRSALSSPEIARQGMEFSNYMLASHPVTTTGWRVISVSNVNNSIGPAYTYLNYLLLTVLIVYLVLLIVTLSVIRMITRPLRKLSYIMERAASEQNLDIRFPVKYTDEIGTLASGYNTLMDHIIALTQQLVQTQEEKRDAQIKLLHMQIKPHFLYNTLETARFMVEMGAEQGAQMISDIAQFYKISLSGVSDYTTVQEELAHLDYYLRIQSQRYSSVFSYHIESDPTVYPVHIVKFTLQPLVENAIYHGLKCRTGEEKGHLSIRAYVEGEDVVISVEDNGVGMTQEQLANLNRRLTQEHTMPSTNIGVFNVNRRLLLSYGKGYGLHIESLRHQYTRVTVRIPKNQEGNKIVSSNDRG